MTPMASGDVMNESSDADEPVGRQPAGRGKRVSLKTDRTWRNAGSSDEQTSIVRFRAYVELAAKTSPLTARHKVVPFSRTAWSVS